MYYAVYHIECATIFQFILPLIVLIIGNILIIKCLIQHNYGTSLEMSNIERSLHTGMLTSVSIHRHPTQRRRNRNQVDRAKVTLVICGIFICCHLFKWAMNIYEFYFRFRNPNLSEEETENALLFQTEWFSIVLNISNILVVFNSSIPFYVYILKVTWTNMYKT